MTVTVPRHEFPAEEAARRAERLDKSAQRKIESLEQSPEDFDRAFTTSLNAALTHCGADPRAAKLPTWEAFVSAMQVSSALFAAATSNEETIERRIGHEPRTIRATGPTSATDAGTWIAAFFLAVICREQDRMTELAKVPISLMRASGAEYDEYIYAWVDTLQTWWLQGGDIGPKLLAAMNGTDPEVARIADREAMLRLIYPPINLFYRYVLRDHDSFNAELANAVKWHKDYWTKDEGRAIDCAGWVAFEPLAIACMAYDAGFPIEVESEYLPKHLLVRSRVGELDT
ncbi:immunity 49 family protein [Streptomyces sp. NPDC001678]|uniref:immunity 49 family protein n=1 Tax=Streptomyces sp. NPDC001678 TaxID=3364599 RepID=UPI0036860949